MKQQPHFVKEFVEKTFFGNRLSLDNRRFVRCKFYDVEFSYSGGLWHLEDCEYHGTNLCHWREAARRTLNLIQKLQVSGFEEQRARTRHRMK